MGAGGEKEVMRLKEFCQQYDVPYQTARDWIKKGSLPAHSFEGSRLLFLRKSEVERSLSPRPKKR